MTEEKVHLSWPPWHTYTDHLKELLHHMKTDNTFADVTLVSDDGRKIRAHKVVLGACSPTMKDLLTNDDTSTIDLKGIAFEEIDSILQFIYLGEATLYEERMQEFLCVAQKLKIKELSKGPETQLDMNYEAVTQSCLTTQNGQNKAHNKTVLKGHECHLCDKSFRQNSQLQAHIKSVHEGVRYPCNQCSYKAKAQRYLNLHIQSVHVMLVSSMLVISVSNNLHGRAV